MLLAKSRLKQISISVKKTGTLLALVIVRLQFVMVM